MQNFEDQEYDDEKLIRLLSRQRFTPVIKQFYADTVFYPTLGWNMLLGRVLKIRNWWDAVEENVILGAYPFESDVPVLAELGVKAVVNTCHEYKGPVEAYREHGITQLHIPTTDFTHPRNKDVERAVQFMQEEIAKGHQVYVHCKAGRARSATIVACWLIKHRGLTPRQAQQQMCFARPHINPRIEQRPVVQAFAAKYLPQD